MILFTSLVNIFFLLTNSKKIGDLNLLLFNNERINLRGETRPKKFIRFDAFMISSLASIFPGSKSIEELTNPIMRFNFRFNIESYVFDKFSSSFVLLQYDYK